ncbi:MAG: FAD-binding protein [Chloroflexi bacterium]|nr:FAD-binding protein [Chloroflexota bacterium]MCI0728103.1 FAD-binding protein [Chloroflexota bacterium]
MKNIEDWSRFISFDPRLYFKPQDLDELKGFLAGVSQGVFNQRRFRVPGSLHSCSDICVSDALLDLSDLPKMIEFNADNTMVTASANWTLHDFLLELSKRSKSLSATGGTDHQTLAGIISTNTAPATSKHTIYELLEWVEYVTIDAGSNAVVEKRVSKTDPAFPAVVCSLGAIGILTKVQFRLIDEPYFYTIQKVIPLAEALGDVASTSEKYDFWRIDWIPEMEKGLLWAAKRISRDQADPAGDYRTDQTEGVLKFLFEHWDKISAAGPLLDNVMEGVYEILALLYGETEATGPLRTMLPVDRRAPLHVAMAEWSFNPADLNNVLQRCREYYRQKGWPNLPIEIELTKTDNYFMSPWNWENLDYVVKFNFMYLTDVCKTEREKDEIRAHLQGLWDHLTQAGIQFKAHWGKINFMDYNFVREQYEIEQFKQFIQPMFLNVYLTERLVPGS